MNSSLSPAGPAATPSRPIPSMSKSALLLSPCTYWARNDAEWYNEDLIDKSDTKIRDDGIIFHEWMDGHISGRDTSYLVTSDQVKYMKMYQHAVEWFGKFHSECSMIESESVVASNWYENSSLRVFYKNRNYPHWQGWQFGTADILAKTKEGKLVVADWKTGSTDGAELQLLTLLTSFYFSYLHSFDKESFTGYETICLQVNESGVWEHRRSYTEDQLICHAEAMKFICEDLNKPKEPVPGIHCTIHYCPHLAHCSKISDVILDIADSDGGQVGSPLIPSRSLMKKITDKPIDSEEAGYTMAIIAAARRKMKYFESGVKDYVKHGKQALYDGYEWAEGNNGFRWRKVK